MQEVTTPPVSLEETTISSMVPGAHIEVAFQKLGRDVSNYVKGSGAHPFDIGNERGYYHIDAMPVLPESLPEMLEKLYQLQDSGSEQSADIATALIENLTTRNDITNEELSWLYKIAQDGGQFSFTTVLEATPGMSKELDKLKWAGRYPRYCPECGHELRLSKQGYSSMARGNLGEDATSKEMESGLKAWVQSWILARERGNVALAKQIKKKLDPEKVYFYFGDPDAPGFRMESFELAEAPAPPSARAKEVADALGILEKRVRLMKGASLSEAVVAKAAPLHPLSTNLQKALLGEAEESPHEAFDALIAYLQECSDTSRDPLVSVLFQKHTLEEGLTSRLREEVAKRKPLVRAIQSLLTEEDEDRKYFTLNKALSSCYTRVMIEGETRGGSHFKFIGKRIFEMMQRALDGDMETPARFLNLYFLEG